MDAAGYASPGISVTCSTGIKKITKKLLSFFKQNKKDRLELPIKHHTHNIQYIPTAQYIIPTRKLSLVAYNPCCFLLSFIFLHIISIHIY